MHSSFWIIKVIVGIIAAMFTLLGATFTFLDSLQNNKTESTRVWFRIKWEIINHSSWLDLPENATKWLLNTMRSFVGSIRTYAARFYRGQPIHTTLSLIDSNQTTTGDYRVIVTPLSIVMALFLIGCWIYWEGAVAVVLLILLVFAIPVLFFSVEDETKEGQGVGCFFFIACIISLATAFVWLKIILGLSIYFAVLMMIFLIPVYTLPIVVLFNLDSISTSKADALSLFFIGVIGGFTITLLALLIGHIADPSAYVPQTFQMLASNVFFDGITMMVTFIVLSKAMAKEGLFRLPFAISIDFLAAALLACSSLYFGLLFTDKYLSVKELLHVLIGRSIHNTQFELSPYFWVMHTTFLPTLLYLLFILFCWTGKILLMAIRWFFGKGQEHKNPLKLTATLFGVFAAVFAILYFIAKET